MRVRALAADFLEPRRTGQHDVGEPACGVTHEQIVADDEVRPREPRRHVPGVGEGRQHVGAEEQHHAHPAFDERFCHARHLVRDVRAGRSPGGRRDIGQILAVHP